MFTSEEYTLQDNSTIEGQNETDGYFFVKTQYLCSNWYWYQNPQQDVITVPTRTILHPQLEFN